MRHHAQVNIAGDALRPNIIIPHREHVQLIPAVAGKRGGAVAVIFEQELPLQDINMSHDLRIPRLVGNGEREVLILVVGHNFLVKSIAIAEDTFPPGTQVIAIHGRLDRAWHPDPEQPEFIGLLYPLKGNHIFPHFGRRRINYNRVRNLVFIKVSGYRIGNEHGDQQRNNAEIDVVVVLPEHDAAHAYAGNHKTE